MMHLRVHDLKEYLYCPRKVFFQYVMPVEKKSTYKMKHGKTEEERIERLEIRRRLKKYGLSGGKRIFRLNLFSPRIGLSGTLDLLIINRDALYPVDFKFTRTRFYKDHIFQLCGYALILEDVYLRKTEKGFLYLLPQEKIKEVYFDTTLRTRTLLILEEIRKMIQEEKIPEEKPSRNRCVDCECRNYCNDIF